MIANLALTIVLIMVAALACAAWRPEWLVRVVGWLTTAGVALNGWLNADVISGWLP